MTQESTHTINGVDYYVKIHGDPGKETVLLTHGMPDTGAMWDKLTKVLVEKGYRVVVPDMLGYGKTGKPADPSRYGGDNVLNDLAELISRLELPKCHVVGHDWGGYASWELVTNLPEQFISHVAVSISHPMVFNKNLNATALRDNWYMYLNTQEDCVQLYTLDDCAFYREFIIPTHPEPDEVCGRLCDPVAMRGMLNWDRGNPLAQLYLAARSGALKGSHPNVKVPTMGIWSADDTYLLEEHMKQSADYVDAEWKYVRLNSGSHWCMLDNPTETNNAIMEWIENHKAS